MLISPIDAFERPRSPGVGGAIAIHSAEGVVGGREIVDRADVPVTAAVTNVVPVDVRVTPSDIVIGDPFM